ncbi:MAG TPA: DUF4190 domain-containing protein [Polyangiaceae bacterium]|nr:DUF4190 domain-containing protein [Polyangiaceae bacterium]
MFDPSAPPASSRGKVPDSAVWSLLLSGLGFACLPGIGGVLGIVLGLVARRDIERFGRAGARLALAGIVVGALNLAVCAAAFGGLIAWIARPSPSLPFAKPVGPTAVPKAHAPGAERSAVPHAGSEVQSRETATTSTVIGAIDLVDIGTDQGSLGKALDQQQQLAQDAGEQLLLWLVLPDCAPCNGVAASLSDPLMQRALEKVRVVRLDVREFALDLRHLGIPVEQSNGTVVVPGFVLLGPQQRPVDYLHGGEWDADIPANIAPVLGSFVRGTYKRRRHPWQAGPRPDAVTL